MPADDIEVIHMTAVEWDQALTNSLNVLGLTWEQLTEQAKAGDFTSLKARQLWLMAGGQGPNQASVEMERLKADLEAAYAERDQQFERKVAALRERDEARRELHLARNQRDEAQGERDALKARLAAVAMVRVWTNEDGKRFVFADDLTAILLPDAATV